MGNLRRFRDHSEYLAYTNGHKSYKNIFLILYTEQVSVFLQKLHRFRLSFSWWTFSNQMKDNALSDNTEYRCKSFLLNPWYKSYVDIILYTVKLMLKSGDLSVLLRYRKNGSFKRWNGYAPVTYYSYFFTAFLIHICHGCKRTYVVV